MVWKTCSTNGRWSEETNTSAQPSRLFLNRRKAFGNASRRTQLGVSKDQRNPEKHRGKNHPRFTGRIQMGAGGPCALSSTTSEQGPHRRSEKIRNSGICG